MEVFTRRWYEIGCIQANYRHRRRSATIAVTMPAGDTAVVGIGEAAGKGRAVRAAEAAILDVKRQLAAVSTTSEASLSVVQT
jgi:cell division GTPase FtsZ